MSDKEIDREKNLVVRFGNGDVDRWPNTPCWGCNKILQLNTSIGRDSGGQWWHRQCGKDRDLAFTWIDIKYYRQLLKAGKMWPLPNMDTYRKLFPDR